MAHTPPSGSSPDEQPEPGASQPSERPVKGGAVLGGAVLGFLGTWFIFAFVLMFLYGVYGDSSSVGQIVIGAAGLLALPLISVALMISPRTRQAGAGLLMGVAIGSVIGAGICATNMGMTW